MVVQFLNIKVPWCTTCHFRSTWLCSALLCRHTLPAKSMEYSENTMDGNSRIWHLNLLRMAWHQPQINMVILMQLPCVVLWTTNGIFNVQKKDIHRNLQKCIIFNSSPKIPHSFQGIRHYMVNLWKYCEYSTVRYWYHAKFATGRRKTIWV